MERKKILVFEDETGIRENLAEILILREYSVDTAANGKEALLKVFSATPDLVICDIMMP